MAGEWESVTIGELADSISDTHARTKDSLVFLNTSDILLGKVLHRTYSSVSHWPGQAKKSIRRDDILFSEIRPANGHWAFVDFESEDFVVSTKLMVIRPRSNRVLPRFLYHFLTCKQTTRWLQHLAESRSGTFPQITFEQVAELEIGLPPLETQRSIATFLDCIDDKIEMNRRMSETLEAMARAIFKSWFVEPATERLPDGWRESTIGDEVRVVGGSTPSTERPEFWDGGSIYWATPKDLSALSSPVLLETERRITENGLAQIGSGLLPAGTVLLSSRAPIGYLAISEVPVAINQGFIAMVCEKALPSLYAWLWAEYRMEEIKGRANGTTFQEINKANFRPIPIVVPPKALIDRFLEVVGSIHRRIVANIRESRTLAAQREALLPKLISGALCASDAEAVAEARL